MTEHTVQLGGDAGPDILAEILATGRCHWKSASAPVLRAGPPRTARPVWQRDEAGRLRAGFEVQPPPSDLLCLCPPWYVDEATGECGPLETALPPWVAETWFRSPLIEPTKVPELLAALEAVAAQLALPVPDVVPVRRCADLSPVPGLRLSIWQLHWWESPWGFAASGGREGFHLYLAQPLLWYGETSVPADANGPSTHEVRRFDGNQFVVIQRREEEEASALARLRKTGLRPAREVLGYCMTPRFEGLWTLPEPGGQRWMEFALEVLPALREEGWRIEQEADARLEICEPDAWYLENHVESDENWFDVELGIQVGEERINLLPILLEGLKQQTSIFNLKGPGDENGKGTRDRRIAVPLPDGRTLAFPATRLRAILSTLVELYDPQALARNQRLKVHRLRALDLAELTAGEGWKWAAPEALRDLCNHLRNLDGLPVAPPPTGLQTALRPYQIEGLRWLQFIRQIGVGGVLADDMGLGKTIQTLAHILVEKEEGRLDRPALVICPTTLVVNWRGEAARFTPALRVLVLHGADRHTTSTPWRSRPDRHHLFPPSARATDSSPRVPLRDPGRGSGHQEPPQPGGPGRGQLRRAIACASPVHRSRTTWANCGRCSISSCRVCSGTSAVSDAIPQSDREGGDETRRELLARRLNPFMLRRTKEEVPPSSRRRPR